MARISLLMGGSVFSFGVRALEEGKGKGVGSIRPFWYLLGGVNGHYILHTMHIKYGVRC